VLETAGELWISLMEKAYAKLHGNYFSLDGGSVGDALVDLTGGVLSKVKLDTEEGQNIIESAVLWSRLTLYCGWGYVMAAMFKVKPAADNAVGPGGLLLNHTYNVVDCHQLSDGARLICVQNPWPVGQWHGAWSDNSRECKNESVLLTCLP
jgi:calpain, invertebrate